MLGLLDVPLQPPVPLGVGMDEGVPLSVAEALAMPLVVGVNKVLQVGVPLPEAVAEPDTVLVPLRVAVIEGLGVEGPDAVEEGLGEAEREGVEVDVPLPVPLGEGVGEGEAEALDEGVGGSPGDVAGRAGATVRGRRR